MEMVCMRTVGWLAARGCAVFTLACTAIACKGGAPASAARRGDFAGSTQSRASSATDRRELSITVYNQNFGLVREVRDLPIGIGRIALDFRDVAALIQPQTVYIRSLAGADALTVLEQNYRYDLLTPQKLLEKYVGKKVKVYRWNEKSGKDEEREGEVLSTEGGAVLRLGDEITYGFPGRITFPEVPPNLVAKPTLVWLLGSTVAQQRVEVTYLTGGLNWQSDYVLVVDDKDTVGDLTGWVTLSNHSGAAYADARLKLVAGDVQHFADAAESFDDVGIGYAKSAAAEKKPAFAEEGLFEYHLYTLDRPTSLLQNEQKQVTLLEANGLKVDKKLVFFGAASWYRSNYGVVASNQKVGVYLDFKNDEKNHLGMPLPKGVVRVYKADASGAKQFIGEDRIDHTPRDEKVRIKMGDAFDVVGDRKQTDWKALGSCTSDSAWEIALRNHKDTAEQVQVMEPVGGEWTVLSTTHPFTKEDARTFSFDVKVQARSETKIKYRVRIKWC
jgi:hypothetical protein